MKTLWFLLLAMILAVGIAVPGAGLVLPGAVSAQAPAPTCPTCDGNTITVDVSTTVNLSPAVPTCTGDPDLCAIFTYDKTGATPDTWKAIFNAGAKKLLVTSGATITTSQVGPPSHLDAPGIEIKGTCGLQVDAGSEIAVESGPLGVGGDIFIHVDGDIDIYGTIRNETTSSTGYPGNITIASCCGDVWVHSTGLVETIGHDYGGSDINILTCCVCRKGDIVIDGLVAAIAPAHVAPFDTTRPDIRVVSFDGKVTINSNSTGEPFWDPYNPGTKYDIWPGLLSWVTTNYPPGSVTVQARGDITVNGHGDDPTGAVYDSFAAVAAVASTASTAQGGTVDVRSKEGSIIGNDRAFQVYRDGSVHPTLLRLWAGQNITLSRPGATADFNPVVDVRGFGDGSPPGGTNELRAYSGGITVNNNASVMATPSGANNFTYGTSYTKAASATVSPDPSTTQDNTVLTPPLLFTSCLNDFGVICALCPGGSITITKVVSGATPGSDWQYTVTGTGTPIAPFTLAAAGESKTFTGLGGGSYTITETIKPGYTVTTSCGPPYDSNSVTLTITEPCQELACTFTNTCTGTITVTKIVSGATPGSDWAFTSNITGHENFTLLAAGESKTFTGIPGVTADYWVTEATKVGWTVTPSATQTKTLPACGSTEFIFTNTSGEGCKWCTKSAVLSQVTQNMGFCCAVPDILVKLGLGSAFDATKLGTGEPATGSLQAAIDYVNSLAWVDPNHDGQIFIGVTGQECGTGTVTTPAECAGQVGRGPYGNGIETVVITNTHSERMNVFGCSVTLTGAVAGQPVITIQNSVGKVTVLDIHVEGGGTGYLVQNNADLVVVKNSRAKDNFYGYDIKVGGKVEITGSPQISGNYVGILVEGSNVTLRTNSDIIDNGIGIKITGNNNVTNGNEVGTSGHGNGTGILVTGKGNSLAGDSVAYNTGNGLEISGSGTSLATGNKIEDEDAGNNGGDGIVVSGNYNTVLKNKQTKYNGGDGIEVSGNYNLIQENVCEKNGGMGFNITNLGNLLLGNHNTLKKNEAKNNTGNEFHIAPNNIDGTGNKYNGTGFSFNGTGGDKN
jgi:hypothetical protein